MWFITRIVNCLGDFRSENFQVIPTKTQVDAAMARWSYRFIHKIFQHNLNRDSEWFRINWIRFTLILWPICMSCLSGMCALHLTIVSYPHTLHHTDIIIIIVIDDPSTRKLKQKCLQIFFRCWIVAYVTMLLQIWYAILNPPLHFNFQSYNIFRTTLCLPVLFRPTPASLYLLFNHGRCRYICTEKHIECRNFDSALLFAVDEWRLPFTSFSSIHASARPLCM